MLLLERRAHYNVELENIAVSGTNVTTAGAFDLSTTGGVIFDSGTTLTYVVTSAYRQFEAGVGLYTSNYCVSCTLLHTMFVSFLE